VAPWEKVGKDWKLETDIWNDDTSDDISHRAMNEPSGNNLLDSFNPDISVAEDVFDCSS
jgi:hypothetical protein